MSPVVADASAVIAILLDEAGADAVIQRISDGALISAVNWAEIVTRISRNQPPGARWRREIERRGGQSLLEIVPFDERLAEVAGALQPLTSRRGLSLGDRACLALAQERGLPAITMDRAWADLSIGVPIEVAR